MARGRGEGLRLPGPDLRGKADGFGPNVQMKSSRGRNNLGGNPASQHEPSSRQPLNFPAKRIAKLALLVFPLTA